MNDRIVFELPVTNFSEFYAFASRILNRDIRTLRVPSTAHLTLLHLGPRGLLVREISETASVSPEEVERGLDDLVRNLLAAPTPTAARVHAFTRLINPPRSFLVAAVMPSGVLVEARNSLWTTFYDWIEALGVIDPRAFGRQSSAIALPPGDWFPHVTLSAEDAGKDFQPITADFELKLGRVRLHA